MLVRVEERFVTVERIIRHYTLFLCQKWSLKSGNTCPSRRDVSLFQAGFVVRDSWRWLHGTLFKLLATPVDLWNRH